MRVMFDSNTLDRAARPERFPKDPRQAEYIKVHDALAAGALKGYFSETLVTLEAIENKDRIDVLGSTRIDSETRATGENKISISLSVKQASATAKRFTGSRTVCCRATSSAATSS